jgi:hypothetical protein
VTRFDRIEAARTARDGSRDVTAVLAQEERTVKKLASFIRTDFAVGRVYDDDHKPFEALRVGMTRDVAEAVAGRMRDAMSDAEVKNALEGRYNIGYRMVRGFLRSGQMRLPFVPRGKIDAMGSTNKPGFAGMTPERRREISAKANAARTASLSAKKRSAIARKARLSIDPEVSRQVALRATAARMAAK